MSTLRPSHTARLRTTRTARTTRAAVATLVAAALATFASPVPCPAIDSTTDPAAVSLPPAVGKLLDSGAPRDCGVVYIHSDDTYYTGISWSGNGQQLPYYGAFAECYSVDGPICGIVLDLTQTGGQADHTIDLYVWADEDGVPGEVLAVRNFVDPGPVAPWPEVSRHILPIPEIDPEGSYWVGYWGNWEGATPGYYLGVDGQSFENGCPYTNIAPSLDFPDGWNHVNVAFGPADALGIGVQIAINEGIGACCLQNFSCVILPESECLQVNGVFQGSAVPCDPELCLPPTGACCLGQNCFVITFDDCFQHDGVYTAGGDCAPNPCVPSGIDDELLANPQLRMTWGRIRTMYR